MEMDNTSEERAIDVTEDVRSQIHESVSQLKEQLLASKRPRATRNYSLGPFQRSFLLKKIDYLKTVLDNLENIRMSPYEELPPWKCRVLGEVFKRKQEILIQQKEMLTHLLNDIRRSLESNSSSNRREIYYKNLHLFKDPSDVSKAVRFISAALEVPPWCIGVSASAKCLIQGPMTIVSGNGIETIDCRPPKGTLIPQCILAGLTFVTDAKYVLILEKDTVFQRLIEEDFVARYGPCILFTAKGFPDIGARLFLRALFDELTIPMFVVADGDPYGMDIMFTYRFGSSAYDSWADMLTVPEIKWLGVFPRDIRHLSIDHAELTTFDMRRVKGLCSRPYVQGNSEFREEVQFFVENRCKCEIEDLYRIAPYFLTDVYIPYSIIQKSFV